MSEKNSKSKGFGLLSSIREFREKFDYANKRMDRIEKDIAEIKKGIAEIKKKLDKR